MQVFVGKKFILLKYSEMQEIAKTFSDIFVRVC